jgi:hypothetical protein
VSTLHEQIKERIDGIDSERVPQAIYDALMAVVERHRPVPCRMKACPGREVCAACGGAVGHYPEGCKDTMAIATALGVEVDHV